MIEVRNLTKFYGPTPSIENISFSVEKGEILGFLGPNGAGKSTTIRILTGLLRPTEGTAAIGGFDVQKHHRQVHNLIGFLPEQAPLYLDMTLAQFLIFMGGIKGLSGKEARREMERTSEVVNLEKERPRLLRNLSKGTRQRAAIAQALLGDPEVLLLDEPTVGLDPSQINHVRKLINDFAGRRTVMLSTHILPEVELTCSRIVIIGNGKIVANGTPKELTKTGQNEYRLEVIGSRSKFAATLDSSGIFASYAIEEKEASLVARGLAREETDSRAALSRMLIDEGFELLEVTKIERRLEDVFLEAIGKRGEKV